MSEERPYLVLVDPGHGGRDSGAIGPAGTLEKDLNLALGLKVQNAAHEGDYLYSVSLTRENDIFVDLRARAEITYQTSVNLFVSLHCNSLWRQSAEGFEIFYKFGSAPSRSLAEQIEMSMKPALLGHKRRGIKEGTFLVLRKSKVPAVLLEVEFISNPSQEAFLLDEENQKKIASCLAEGIEYFLEG